MEEVFLRVEGVYLCLPRPAVASVAVECLECVIDGLVGDRHFGQTKLAGVREKGYRRGEGAEVIHNNRQFSAVSVEELRQIAELMGIDNLAPEMLGANILFSETQSLTKLPVLTQLWFESGPVLRVFGENLPCKSGGDEVRRHYPGSSDVPQAFVRHAIGRRGIVGFVERAGSIRTGDIAKVVFPDWFIREAQKQERTSVPPA